MRRKDKQLVAATEKVLSKTSFRFVIVVFVIVIAVFVFVIVVFVFVIVVFLSYVVALRRNILSFHLWIVR